MFIVHVHCLFHVTYSAFNFVSDFYSVLFCSHSVKWIVGKHMTKLNRIKITIMRTSFVFFQNIEVLNYWNTKQNSQTRVHYFNRDKSLLDIFFSFCDSILFFWFCIENVQPEHSNKILFNLRCSSIVACINNSFSANCFRMKL